MEQMGEIQKLMKEKDQAVFQRVGTTVTKRVTKLENIFNDKVFDNLSKSFRDSNKRKLFLRMIDKYLGDIEYQETEGSVRAEVRQMLGPREDLHLVKYNEPRNPSTLARDSTAATEREATEREETEGEATATAAAATTSSSDVVSGDAPASGNSQRNFLLIIAPNDAVGSPMKLRTKAADLGELKTNIMNELMKKKYEQDKYWIRLERSDYISISEVREDGTTPVFFTSLDEIESKVKVQIHKVDLDDKKIPIGGGPEAATENSLNERKERKERRDKILRERILKERILREARERILKERILKEGILKKDKLYFKTFTMIFS